MNPNEIALQASCIKTLEVFAFMIVDETEWDSSIDCPVGVTVDLKGTINGVLEARTQKSVLDGICSTILGMIPDESESEIAENCLKEVVNIVAGNFITERYGLHAKIDLGIPQLSNQEMNLKRTKTSPTLQKH